MPKHIVFVESRYRTLFWALVAEHLESFGHRISWIVQNPVFAPKNGQEVRILTFPKWRAASDRILTEARTADMDLEAAFQTVAGSDRNVLYRGGTSDHYPHYWKQIDSVIGEWVPDVVVGELGNFHTHLTAIACERRKIPFFDVDGSRYPPGRFSFFRGLEPLPEFGEPNPQWSPDDIARLALDISTGTTIPDYMRTIGRRPSLMKIIRARATQLRFSLLGHLFGEQFNQRSLRQARREYTQVKGMRARWAQIAAGFDTESALRDNATLLYPLQMQPELNIDVWGRRHRDQTELLRRVIEVLPEGWQVAIKPNPKANLELTSELIDLVESQPRLVPLPFGFPMHDVLPNVSAVLTVTGTVAYEAVLRQVPTLTLGRMLTSLILPFTYIEDVDAIGSALHRIDAGDWPRPSDPAAILQALIATSYRGIVSDPLSNPRSMGEANIALVAKAFDDMLRRVGTMA